MPDTKRIRAWHQVVMVVMAASAIVLASRGGRKGGREEEGGGRAETELGGRNGMGTRHAPVRVEEPNDLAAIRRGAPPAEARARPQAAGGKGAEDETGAGDEDDQVEREHVPRGVTHDPHSHGSVERASGGTREARESEGPA